MFTIFKRAAILSVGAFALITTSACAVYAQGGRHYPRATVHDAARAHFERGYRDGLRAGERDLRSRDSFSYRDERAWRRAPSSAYREGFERGYADGYRGGRYGRDNRYGRDDRYGRDGRYGGFTNAAAERGFRDGYAQGRDDARDRDRFDPVRAKKYRDGDDGYDRRFGSRDDWKREYRAAFRQGYERGYREER